MEYDIRLVMEDHIWLVIRKPSLTFSFASTDVLPYVCFFSKAVPQGAL